jgi:hypothetical protein
MAEEPDKKKRTIFILYVPGGGMRGIIPAVVLSRLEQLLETPSGEAFQVFNGVSTGSILAAALTARDENDPTRPKLTAKDVVDLFCENGPKFFPPIPYRIPKMFVSNVLSVFEDYIDPLKAESDIVGKLKSVCRDMDKQVFPKHKVYLQKLEEASTTRWLTKSEKKKALNACSQLFLSCREYGPQRGAEIAKGLTEATALLAEREVTGRLSKIFKSATLHAMHFIQNKWSNNFLYDPEVPKKIYQGLIGDRRMGDALRSTYISAYSLNKNRIWTFFNRKSDFFSVDPNTPSMSSRNNPRLWDAVLASTAHPVAYIPHRTEDGMLFSDKAPLDTPERCVEDVMRYKPADADIKLIIMNPGEPLTAERDADNLNNRARYGLIGNLLRGREIAEIESYKMSDALDRLKARIGKQNIIEFTPHFKALSHRDAENVPSADILDASSDNIRRLLMTGLTTVRNEDAKIRELAAMMAENMRNLGQMDDAKYERVLNNIRSPDPTVCPLSLQQHGDDSNCDQESHGIQESLQRLKNSFGTASQWLKPKCREQDNDSDMNGGNDCCDDKDCGTGTNGPSAPGPA